MSVLVADLKRRHGRKMPLPLSLNNFMAALDLLCTRTTDTYPTFRLLLMNGGAPTIRVTTCFPDVSGECVRSTGDRFKQIKEQIAVAPELAAFLQEKGLVYEGGAPLKWGKEEWHITPDTFAFFKKTFGDIEYTPLS